MDSNHLLSNVTKATECTTIATYNIALTIVPTLEVFFLRKLTHKNKSRHTCLLKICDYQSTMTNKSNNELTIMRQFEAYKQECIQRKVCRRIPRNSVLEIRVTSFQHAEPISTIRVDC